jgi:hypothetical protein
MTISTRLFSGKLLPLLMLLPYLSLVSCKISKSNSLCFNAGNDPNFKIIQNTDEHFKNFNRKTEVFGLNVFAVPEVKDSVLLHVSNVLAQYIDNNEDGIPDNQLVMDSLLSSNASMVVWFEEKDLRRLDPPDNTICQDVGNDETNPQFVQNGMKGGFDASLEEVLHLITHAGYAKVYPDVFGEKQGSLFALAMDQARGGYFGTIPKIYPKSAWYSYDDKTCTYDCQIAEYQYWIISSILGAQQNRSDEIGHEWSLHTKELVMQVDTLAYKIVIDTSYHLPRKLPDGSYRH